MSRRRAMLASALVVSLLALGVVSALGLRSVDDPPRTTSESSVELVQRYERSFVDLWVRGCIGSGESVAFCRCAIDEYTARLRPDEFETASAVANSGGDVSELPEHLRDVIEDVERTCE